MIITVFTPTYNRAYRITDLYESLCRQTCKDFEWLVVDDGSTDDTEQLINSFIAENRFDIRYIKKANGGKHTAINVGVNSARGGLFFIVDSDDILPDDAVKDILSEYKYVCDRDDFAGVCGLKANFDNTKVGGEESWTVIEASSLDARVKYKIKGDLAEVFKTNVLRQYPFPEFEDERFCSEALIWNRISQRYKLRFFYKKIYLCEYLPDGLTAAITRVRIKSPRATSLYYSEYYHCNIPLKEKVKTMINYWRFSPYYHHLNFKQRLHQIGICSLLFYPIAMLMYNRDKRNFK